MQWKKQVTHIKFNKKMPNKFFAKRKKTKITIIFLLALIVFGIIYFSVNKKKPSLYETVLADNRNLTQTVREVGSVKSAEEIKLSFPTGGKLSDRLVELGDLVKKDQIIAELDYSAAIIERDNAVSNLTAAKASLQKTLAGATTNEISIAEAQVSQAKKSYEAAIDTLTKTQDTVAEEIRQAEKTLNDLTDSSSDTITPTEASLDSAKINLENTKSTYQTAINNSVETILLDSSAKLSVGNTALDNVDKLITDKSIEDSLSSKNRAYLNNTKNGYEDAENLYDIAVSSLAVAMSDKSEVNVKKASDDVLFFLKKTAYVLDNAYAALENSTITQTTLDSYKTSISTQITYNNTAISVIQTDRQTMDSAYLSYSTNVATALNSLNQAQAAYDNALLSAQNGLASARLSGDARLSSAESSVKTSKEAYEVVNRQLSQLKAPARSEDVVLARTKVDQAQASLDLANKKIEDSMLRSPIDGKLVRSAYEIGEQIPAGATSFAVLKENNFEIEVDISESDIAKIKLDDEVEITLDAFGEDRKFSGKVFFIEPAETVIQEVVYYKVKINFNEDNQYLDMVKSGMTANVSVFTGKRDNVLAIPERAVLDKDNKKIIRILENDVLKEVPVKTGLRGDDGYIEITSGAKNGEEVVVFIKSN